MRDRIIQAVVKNLRESYSGVTAENILTDYIYSAFFKSSLELTIEEVGEASVVSRECRKLIEEIDANAAKSKAAKPKKKGGKKS